MKKVYLKDTTSIRQALARVYFDLEQGNITPQMAHRLTYVLQALLKAAAQEWQESRVTGLWEKLDELEGEDDV